MMPHRDTRNTPRYIGFFPRLKSTNIFFPCALSFAVLGGAVCAQESSNPPAMLSVVEVVGSGATQTPYAQESAGAKTDLPLRELPQSVQVVTRQTLEDLAANQLDDVLDYVSGVARENNFGGLIDNFSIRGIAESSTFSAPILFNGFSASRGYSGPADLAGVERVEFLKGPAAALYGSSEPGGTLNIVSKRPLWQAAHSAQVSYGRFDAWRAALDSSMPLNERVAVRFNAALENKHSFRDTVQTKREVFIPALTWKLSADTLLEYSGEIQRHRTPQDRGIVAVNKQLGVIPISRFLGEPADDPITVKNSTHQFILSQHWNDNWLSRFGVSYRETSLNGYANEPTSAALLPNGDLRRMRRFRDFNSEDLSMQAELQGKFATGSVEHELLAGWEGYKFNQRMILTRSAANDPYLINIYNPVYRPNVAALPVMALTSLNNTERLHNNAFYVQDTIKLAEQWRLLAGVRVDKHHQSVRHHHTGVSSYQSPSATSPRVGVSWLPTQQWTLYANAGKSFLPNAGTDAASNSFDPQNGRVLETGVKWEDAAQTMGMTLAVFDIRKRNVLTADPANPGFSITSGEVRSRGVEWDFAGRLATHWRISASLAYNKAEVLRDNNLAIGSGLNNSPKLTGSLLAVYEAGLQNGQKYSVGAGLNHIGKRLGQSRTQADVTAGTAAFYLPAYTTVKLVGAWHINPMLRVTLDVNNLFDKTYYASSYNTNWVVPGSPRTVMASVQAKF